MDDARGMRGRKRAAGLNRDLENVRQIQSRLRVIAQRTSVDELRRDERRFAGPADLVDREDVRMIQCRGGPGFLHKPAQAVLVRRDFDRQNLQRDLAIERGVLRQVHLAHPARAERGANFVMANPCA
jgi:hypothetical protein